MKNPSVVVTPKIVGKFECDLTIEDRPIPDIYKPPPPKKKKYNKKDHLRRYRDSRYEKVSL